MDGFNGLAELFTSASGLIDSALVESSVVCFALMLARAGGWVAMVPMFGAKGGAGIGRMVIAIAIALALAPVAVARAAEAGVDLPTSPVPFMVAAVGELAVGAITGWVTGLLFAAAEMAGSMADATSGLSFASLVDPVSGSQQASFARLFSITFLAVCFAADAHHLLLAGFAGTLDAVPPGVWPAFEKDALGAVATGVMALMRAAVEVGAPLLGALFLTEVALGLVSKFYPQMNVLMLGLGVKAGVALSTAGIALMLLPQRVEPIVSTGLRTLQGIW